MKTEACSYLGKSIPGGGNSQCKDPEEQRDQRLGSTVVRGSVTSGAGNAVGSLITWGPKDAGFPK